MRTDVKVGLVCVLVLVIAVVIYFAMAGKPAAPANERAKPALTKTDLGTPATPSPHPSLPGDMASPPPSSPAVGTPPVGYSQTPLIPGPLGQTPTPYSPPTASTTGPVSGSPLYSTGANPLLPPSESGPGAVPPLTNNGAGGTGLGEPGAPAGPAVGPVVPATPATPSLGGEEHPGEPGPSRDGSTIVPGPAAPAAHSHGPAAYPPLTNGGSTAGEYIVVTGDTLTRIAKKNHTTIAAIKAANPGINPDVLKVKQVLKLPEAGSGDAASPAATMPAHGTASRHGSGSAGAVHSSSARPASAAGGTYRVKKGDTLRKIAKSALGNEGLWRRIFRMNRGELASPNDLTPGMVLKIPAR